MIIITLTSAQFSSLFPNIIKDKNDKFYYNDTILENERRRVITFTEGAYEVKDINAIIQQNVSNESIR